MRGLTVMHLSPSFEPRSPGDRHPASRCFPEDRPVLPTTQRPLRWPRDDQPRPLPAGTQSPGLGRPASQSGFAREAGAARRCRRSVRWFSWRLSGDSNDQIIASARLERRHQFPPNSEGLRSCQDLQRHLWILSPIQTGNRDPPNPTPDDFTKLFDDWSRLRSTPDHYRLSAICQPNGTPVVSAIFADPWGAMPHRNPFE